MPDVFDGVRRECGLKRNTHTVENKGGREGGQGRRDVEFAQAKVQAKVCCLHVM